MSEPSRIPVNLISGPLGAGKTTLINHVLGQRPDEERWAVLVNEYGLIGVDAALMEPSSHEPAGVEIREVAGGCICCSAAFMFEVSLVRLLQRRPHRLLIEPTGLAALSGILDTLDRPGIREAVDVRSILCVLDPRRLDEDLQQDVIKDQIEAADILLASRPDLASDAQLHRFHAWAGSLFPPKRFVAEVEKGRIHSSFLDLARGRSAAVPRGGHEHGTDHAHASTDHGSTDHAAHHHDSSSAGGGAIEDSLLCDAARPVVQRVHRSNTTSTIGWICWSEIAFDAERIEKWLRALAQLPGARRTKAVLRTTEGWWSFNYAGEAERLCPSSYRRDSRLEVVIESRELPDANELEEGLRRCMTTTDNDLVA